jgi:hypothetical protein
MECDCKDCNCSNRWTRWVSLDDQTDLAMLEVESKCQPTEIVVVQQTNGRVSTEPIGFGHDTVRPSAAAATEQTAIPISAPCKVTYIIKNSFASAYNIASFSTGNDTYVFGAPIGPGQSKTIRATSTLPGPGACCGVPSGVLELAHTTTPARMTIGAIKICRLCEPE